MELVILPMTIAGLIAGILALLVAIGILNSSDGTYIVFDTIRSAVFYFFPIYISISSARRFKANEVTSLTLAMIVLSSSIDGQNGLSLFGIDLPVITYSSTFIPVFLGVYSMSRFERLYSQLPVKMFQNIFVPLLSLISVLVLTLLVFGPIGTLMTEMLSFLCLWLSENLGLAVTIGLYALIHPFMIITGCNSLALPIILVNLDVLGYDPILITGLTLSNITTCGVMIGCCIKEKNPEEKEQLLSYALSAGMGIPVPAMFRVLVPNRKLLSTVMIVGSFSGVIAGLFQVKSYIFSGSIPGLPTYLMGDTMNFIYMIIASFLSVVLGILTSYRLYDPHQI